MVKDKGARKFSDLIEFAKWCRLSNLLNLQKIFTNKGEFRVGRGVVFHIAPSNVPINFAFTLVCGLLSGNSNIVRLPSFPYEQNLIVLKALDNLLNSDKYRMLKNFIHTVTYAKESSYTDFFSNICDVRVIWGGDNTINTVRQSSLQPKSFDITFPDRFSFSVFKSEAILKSKDIERICANFYNDTFLFDQNACTSPHLIIWVGNDFEIALAKKVFWSSFISFVENKYITDPSRVLEKISKFYRYMSIYPVKDFHFSNKLHVIRASISNLDSKISELKSSCGLFYEFDCNGLSTLNEHVTRKYQTVSYLGFSKLELENYFSSNNLLGIDRVVPVGQTQNFDLIWDGFDLISSMSRTISID